jgi:hypothetical protein
MKLEAVIVCVEYGDFLATTLPANKHQFDRLIVVTSPEDKETQRVCRYYGVPHLQTDVLRTRWGEMHKAKGINKGLEQLDLDDWVLHLDADIVLPPTCRQLIERADLDKTCLYGCDRYQVPSWEAWQLHQAMPPLQQDNYHVHLDTFPIAPRFSGSRMGGYAPPGYFQLWNAKASGVTRYPEDHDDASRTDVLFTAQWWRNKRHLLPEFVVYHLESEQCPPGTNWEGRVSRRWGPIPDERDHRHPRHHRQPPHLWHHHHRRPHPYGPGPEKS